MQRLADMTDHRRIMISTFSNPCQIFSGKPCVTTWTFLALPPHIGHLTHANLSRNLLWALLTHPFNAAWLHVPRIRVYAKVSTSPITVTETVYLKFGYVWLSNTSLISYGSILSPVTECVYVKWLVSTYSNINIFHDIVSLNLHQLSELKCNLK